MIYLPVVVDIRDVVGIDQMKCPFVSVVRIVRFEWFDRSVELCRMIVMLVVCSVESM